MARAKRVAQIDALRGIAALAVVVQHALERLYDVQPLTSALRTGLGALLLHGINLGRFGVLLFFLISGFVVPFSFRGGEPIRAFVRSRLFRLYPAYWVSIAAALLAGQLMGRASVSTAQVLANATMMQKAFGQHDLLGPFWTLFYELVFYIACIALAWAGRLACPRAISACAIGAITLSVVPLMLVKFGVAHVPLRVDMIFLAFMFTGSLLRLALLLDDPGAKRLCWPVVLGLGTAIPVTSGFLFPVDENHTPYLMPVPQAAGSFAALIAFLVFATYRGLGRPRLVWIGTISYSIYLFHPIVLDCLSRLWRRPTGWTAAEFLAACLVSVIFVSALSYYLIEAPFVRLGRNRRGGDVPGHEDRKAALA